MNEIKSVQLNPIYTPTLVKIQNPEVELEPVNSFCEDKPQSQIEKKKNEMKSLGIYFKINNEFLINFKFILKIKFKSKKIKT